MRKQKIQTNAFVYEDIRKIKRHGNKTPATGKPMKEALETRLSDEMLSKAIATYCRHIQKFDQHDGINGLPEGTIFHAMKNKGLLSIAQFKAAEYIYTDAIQAWGKSGKQTSSYSEAISVSGGGRDPDMARTTMHQDRFKRLVEHLHRHHWGFLVMVVEEIKLLLTRT